jgi:hypothetical protein
VPTSTVDLVGERRGHEGEQRAGCDDSSRADGEGAQLEVYGIAALQSNFSLQRLPRQEHGYAFADVAP